MKQQNILIPEMGEGVNEATITHFSKKVGEHVEEGDVLVEISTDKINNEICSEYEGIVAEICGNENEVLKVGEVIMTLNINTENSAITTENELPKEKIQTPEAKTTEIFEAKEKQIPKQKNKTPKTDAEKLLDDLKKRIHFLKVKINEISEPPHRPQKTETTTKPIPQTPTQEKTEVPENKNTFLSPLIKNIIQKERLSEKEILRLKGSGNNGRITKTDVFEYLKTKQTPAQKENISTEKKISQPEKNIEETETLSPIRKTIARNMVVSKQTIPHAVSIEEILLDPLVRFKKLQQASFTAQNIKLTFSPILMYAVVLALKENKRIYATLKEDVIHFPDRINLGFAFAKNNGDLIVPVIKSAEKMSFGEFVVSYNNTVQKVLENHITLEDLNGCNFTVSNLGSYKGTFGIPIIAPGQSATMSIGTMTKRPAVITKNGKDKIVVRNGSWFALSHDHRTLDGDHAGKFFQSLKKHIETFEDIIHL